MGEPEQWEIAEAALRDALEATGTPYRVNEGDGAFYGPKIDFHLEDCIGRTWQCGTIQLDFQMPERFDMHYAGADGQEHRPVMLHRALMGSLFSARSQAARYRRTSSIGTRTSWLSLNKTILI